MQSFYASPWPFVAYFGIFLAVTVVIFIKREALIGKSQSAYKKGIWGSLILTLVTGIAAGVTFLHPALLVTISSDEFTCSAWKHGVRWQYVSGLKLEWNKNFDRVARFTLDDRYLDLEPWNDAIKARKSVLCSIGGLTTSSTTIFDRMNAAWLAARNDTNANAKAAFIAKSTAAQVHDKAP